MGTGSPRTAIPEATRSPRTILQATGSPRTVVIRLVAALVAFALAIGLLASCGTGEPAPVTSPGVGDRVAGAATPGDGPTGPLTIALAGDVMLGRGVNETIALEGPGHPWGDVLPLMLDADLLLVNLETTITSETTPWSADKPFNYRAYPGAAETLRLGGVDFASVANNHLGDFGIRGLLDTLEALDGVGVSYAGAGADLAAAASPAVLSSGGLRVAVVAFADYPPEWAALSGSPGINFTPISTEAETFDRIRRALMEAREKADLVVFSIHWGPNMRERPPDAFRRFARKVVDSGADVFWGHSAHVVQGIEVHNGKLILYDTGDFVDDYAVHSRLRNDLSALFLLIVDDRAVRSVELVPVEIANQQVDLARGARREWFVARAKGLIEEMGTKVAVTERGLFVEVAAQ